METKTCPSCGTEVPAAAARCKTCFHDFEAPPQRSSSGPLALLALLAGMALIGAGTFYYVSSQPTDQRILVNQATRTIQWISQYQDGKLQTDQISWDEIARIEHVITRGGDFEIVAVTLGGDRKVVKSDPDVSLMGDAKAYADLMGKPLELVDETGGFGN